MERSRLCENNLLFKLRAISNCNNFTDSTTCRIVFFMYDEVMISSSLVCCFLFFLTGYADGGDTCSIYKGLFIMSVFKNLISYKNEKKNILFFFNLDIIKLIINTVLLILIFYHSWLDFISVQWFKSIYLSVSHLHYVFNTYQN